MRSAIICTRCKYAKKCPAAITSATERGYANKDLVKLTKEIESMKQFAEESGYDEKDEFQMVTTFLKPEIRRFLKKLGVTDVIPDLSTLYRVCKHGGGLKE